MIVVCLDFEGVLGPEIWFELAKNTGIKSLEQTTATEPDYAKLMSKRIVTLRENNIRIDDVREIVSKLEPLTGAREFVKKLQEKWQIAVITDSFYNYVTPLTDQLYSPIVLANELQIDDDGFISSFRFRIGDPKGKAVQAFQDLNFYVISAGDSYNDLSMLSGSDHGILFKAESQIKTDYPNFETAENYDELFQKIATKAEDFEQ